ncbi:MAG: pyridoxal phosphate-dependent aminotransferase [Acidiferrobacterales bacterium]|nr:pyridoxal phosphate-dependent aminotransferase [Acidiferrobacterales bacterium]
MSDISRRMNQVQAPIIPEVADLIVRNPGTISLGQGVVYYKPPEQISQGVQEFMQSNSHHYQAVEGIPALRNLIGQKLQDENGIETEGYEIVVSAGSNMGFLNAILAIADSDDEIILLKPWYFNHEMAVRIAQCTPVSVDTDEQYQPDVKALEKAITAKTRAIVTISPNNPTGAVYDREMLIKINNLCRDANLFHIHDEAYEYFCYGDAEHFSPASVDSAIDHTISLYSTSKSYGMANWRIGYMLIPPRLFKPVRKIQDTNLICPSVISQYAAMECLKVGRGFYESRIGEIDKVRRHFQQSLHGNSTASHGRLQGAFYAFLHLPQVGLSDMDIVRFLIEQYQVAVIPGVAFGMASARCIRASYGAMQPATVVEGIDRLTQGLKYLPG